MVTVSWSELRITCVLGTSRRSNSRLLNWHRSYRMAIGVEHFSTYEVLMTSTAVKSLWHAGPLPISRAK